LNGLGTGSSAVLTFTNASGGDVIMYKGSSSRSGEKTNQYVWDSSTGVDVTRIFGYVDSGDCSSTQFAGTLNSLNTLVITYVHTNGETQEFNVPVSVITIINNQAQ
jgi:hypothetical protein